MCFSFQLPRSAIQRVIPFLFSHQNAVTVGVGVGVCWGKDGLKGAKKEQLYQQNMQVSVRTERAIAPLLAHSAFF